MNDVEKRARQYVALNAAESGTDVLLLDAADEIATLSRQLAAAPDLLAALKDWLAYAEENLHEFDLDDCSGEKLCPRCESSGCIQDKIKRARAAIARAEASPTAAMGTTDE